MNREQARDRGCPAPIGGVILRPWSRNGLPAKIGQKTEN